MGDTNNGKSHGSTCVPIGSHCSLLENNGSPIVAAAHKRVAKNNPCSLLMSRKWEVLPGNQGPNHTNTAICYII